MSRRKVLQAGIVLAAVGILAALVASTAQASAANFVHIAAATNITADYTDVDNALTNGNPSARLLITSNLSPNGGTAVVNNHPIGVRYDSKTSKWSIFNQDMASMTVGAAFNVRIEDPAATNTPIQKATGSNITVNWTDIGSGLTDRKPNAIVMITPNSTPDGARATYDNHNSGVWYNSYSNKWAIYYEDRLYMTGGPSFNTELFSEAGDNVFVHTATTANTPGRHTVIDNPLTNGNPDAVLFVTHNWGSSGGKYVDSPLAVNYFPAEQKWAIVATNPAMLVGAMFNVLVTSASPGASAVPVTKFTIASSAGPNGSVSPSGTISVDSGNDKTFAITPNASYHVADVLVDGKSVGAVSSYTFPNVTASHTFSATFAADTTPPLATGPVITATAGPNGSISPSGSVTVTSGSDQRFDITPSASYTVADVKVDGESVGALTTFTFSNVTTNHTISVAFVGTPSGSTGAYVVVPGPSILAVVQRAGAQCTEETCSFLTKRVPTSTDAAGHVTALPVAYGLGDVIAAEFGLSDGQGRAIANATLSIRVSKVTGESGAENFVLVQAVDVSYDAVAALYLATIRTASLDFGLYELKLVREGGVVIRTVRIQLS